MGIITPRRLAAHQERYYPPTLPQNHRKACSSTLATLSGASSVATTATPAPTAATMRFFPFNLARRVFRSGTFMVSSMFCRMPLNPAFDTRDARLNLDLTNEQNHKDRDLGSIRHESVHHTESDVVGHQMTFELSSIETFPLRPLRTAIARFAARSTAEFLFVSERSATVSRNPEHWTLPVYALGRGDDCVFFAAIVSTSG